MAAPRRLSPEISQEPPMTIQGSCGAIKLQGKHGVRTNAAALECQGQRAVAIAKAAILCFARILQNPLERASARNLSTGSGVPFGDNGASSRCERLSEDARVEQPD